MDIKSYHTSRNIINPTINMKVAKTDRRSNEVNERESLNFNSTRSSPKQRIKYLMP